MKVNTREAMKIARATAKEAGYTHATVSDTTYDDEEETYDIDLYDEDEDLNITVTIDEKSGEVLDFTTD